VVVASMLEFIDVLVRHGVWVVKECSHELNGAGVVFVVSSADPVF
jgi:hypothetical protein